MSKYHIGKNGLPGVCKATEKPCPLGGDDVHFNTIEAAQKYADKQNEANFGIIPESSDTEHYESLIAEKRAMEKFNYSQEKFLNTLSDYNKMMSDKSAKGKVTAMLRKKELSNLVEDAEEDYKSEVVSFAEHLKDNGKLSEQEVGLIFNSKGKVKNINFAQGILSNYKLSDEDLKLIAEYESNQ